MHFDYNSQFLHTKSPVRFPLFPLVMSTGVSDSGEKKNRIVNKIIVCGKKNEGTITCNETIKQLMHANAQINR